MYTGRHQSADVGDVDHQVGTDLVGDLTEPLEIDEARIGACTADDHLGAAFLSHLQDLIVVDGLGVGADPVEVRVEELAGYRDLGTMGEVSAHVEAHSQDRVTGVEQGHVDGEVRL